jgi:hypothetical protein
MSKPYAEYLPPITRAWSHDACDKLIAIVMELPTTLHPEEDFRLRVEPPCLGRFETRFIAEYRLRGTWYVAGTSETKTAPTLTRAQLASEYARIIAYTYAIRGLPLVGKLHGYRPTIRIHKA